MARGGDHNTRPPLPRSERPTDEDADPPRTGPDGLGDALMRRTLKERMFGVDPEPLRVGRYRLLSRIGAGGMGVVYEAIDPELERKVALKLMRPSLPGGRRQMLREARALARLSDPHVVTVHEVGEIDRRVYIAMELVEGDTLRRWLETQRPVDEVCRTLLQAGRGLQAAHDAGLVHRDYKPDNVIVGLDGRTRVTDFGLAQLESQSPTAPGGEDLEQLDGATQPAPRAGTPAYMAPEQLDDGELDARADQYAFCLVALQALGVRPLPGASTTARPDATPPKLIEALERGVRLDPAERHGSLQPILAELERASSPSHRPAVRRSVWHPWGPVLGLGVFSLTAVCLAADREDETRAPEQSDLEAHDTDAPIRSGPAAAALPPPSADCDPPSPADDPPEVIDRKRDQLATLLGHMDPADAEYPEIAVRLAEKHFALSDATMGCTLLEQTFGSLDETAAGFERATCLYDAACVSGERWSCPEGTRMSGATGCAPTVTCAQQDVCTPQDFACCTREAIFVEFEALEQQAAGEDEAARASFDRVLDLTTTACTAGDADACSYAAKVAKRLGESERSRELTERACELHHPKACERDQAP